MSAEWYCLHVKPHKEQSTYKLLLSRELVPTLTALAEENAEFDVFFPSMRVKPVNPRSARIRPYFPGYLFVYVDLDVVGDNALSWLPGAHGLVTFGDQPAIVPPNFVLQLKKHIADLATTGGYAVDEFKDGEPVRIVEGPFAGYEAIFDTNLAGMDRVQVLLTFLSGQPQKLKLDRNAIQKQQKK